MSDGAPATPGEGIRTALALYEFALEMRRAGLRRQFPDADAAEIERRLREWLLDRRGAERGDAVGRPCRRVQEPA